MSALLDEVVEKIHLLKEEEKQRLLHMLRNELLTPLDEDDEDGFVEDNSDEPFDFETWRRDVDKFHEELKAKYGDDYQVGSLELLRELREEASYPRGSRP